MNVTHMFPRF